MRKIFCPVVLLMCASMASAQKLDKAALKARQKAEQEMVEAMTQKTASYAGKIDSLCALRDSVLLGDADKVQPSAYALRLYAPSAFYHSALMQRFSPSVDECESTDVKVLRSRMANDVMAQLYVENPSLVERTAGELESAGFVRGDVASSLSSDALLASQLGKVSLFPMYDDDDLTLHVRKPNFWKFYGSGSLQFTQSYFSENWYQGGDDSYAANAMVSLHLNYDDKRKIQWENTLDVQLGFQTNESDTVHSFKPTNNLMRITSKFGYKAIKNFYYTTMVRAQTQLVPNYNNNTDDVITSIFNPLDVAFSIGIDWKFQALKGKLKGSIYLAPGTYDLRYVGDTDLSRRYGLDEGCHTKHKFGPSAQVNLDWQLFKHVSWNSRLYWVGDFDKNNNKVEWENTFNFTMNKYLSAKLFVYPRFDNSSEKFESESTGYFMLKEWFSLGLNYNF